MDTATHEKIKQDFLMPFIDGVKATFKTMASTEAHLQTLNYAKEDDHFFGDVSGVMGISGKNGEGFVGITFPEALAEHLVCKLLNISKDELEEGDIFDGVGEMVNMITGNAKNALLGTTYHFNLSLPNVIAGKDHEVGFRKDTPCWCATIQVNEHVMYLLVGFASK